MRSDLLEDMLPLLQKGLNYCKDKSLFRKYVLKHFFHVLNHSGLVIIRPTQEHTGLGTNYTGPGANHIQALLSFCRTLHLQ